MRAVDDQPVRRPRQRQPCTAPRHGTADAYHNHDEDPALLHGELYRKSKNELVALVSVMRPVKQRHVQPAALGGAA